MLHTKLCFICRQRSDKQNKSLWSQYARNKTKYLAKAKKSGSGLDDIIQGKWAHFKPLTFLDSAINARSSKSNIETMVRV